MKKLHTGAGQTYIPGFVNITDLPEEKELKALFKETLRARIPYLRL